MASGLPREIVGEFCGTLGTGIWTAQPARIIYVNQHLASLEAYGGGVLEILLLQGINCLLADKKYQLALNSQAFPLEGTSSVCLKGVSKRHDYLIDALT